MKEVEVRREKGHLYINIYENDEVQSWLHTEDDEIALIRDACNEYLGKNETGSFEVDGTLRSPRKEVYLGKDSILKDLIVKGTSCHMVDIFKEAPKSDEEINNCHNCKYLTQKETQEPCESCNWKLCDYNNWQPKDPDGKFGYASDTDGSITTDGCLRVAEPKEEKVSDEEKSCANCAKFNICTRQVSPTKPYCSEYRLAVAEPKEAKEKHEQTYDKALKECRESTVTAQYVKSKAKEKPNHVPDVGKKPKTDTESPVEWCRVFASYHDLPNDRKLKGLLCLKAWVKEELEKQKTNAENPKKLKYVCTACVGTKCIKKTIGVLPTNCKYPQAKWKLKVVK